MSYPLTIQRAAVYVAVVFAVIGLLAAGEARAVDAAAAEALARQNNCFKCHAVDKVRVGPAWKDVAAKLKGDKDAQAKLITHLTTGPKDHPVIKAKSSDDTKNLIDWILSL